MFMRLLKAAGIEKDFDMDAFQRFLDDDEIDDWAREAVYFMAGHDIVKGVGGNTFGPASSSTIEQAIAMALRCYKTFATK